MFEEFLSDLDSSQKLELVKDISILAGGIIVGYSLKKVLDSYDLDVVKSNAVNMIDDYINPTIKYVDNLKSEAMDNEENEE